ncbi:MAG: hypothetical protein ACM3X7_10480 [Solirubrobacterales bacterium]
MYKSKKIALVLTLCFTLAMILTACSSGGTANTDSTKSDVLAAYNKVSLGMTKDQVDKTLGLEAKKETSQYALEGSYNYIDSKTGFGVSVVYNSSNIVYSKTAIIGSHKNIAPFCKKPVNEAQEDKVTKDMPYQDVVSLLGGEGVEVSTTATEKNPTESIGTIRNWANSDGSGLQVVFSKDNKARSALYFDHD